MKRVKTLGELAAEFGSRLHFFGERMIAVSDTGPTAVAVYIDELGKPFDKDPDWSPSDVWRKTFLKDIPRRFKTNEELINSGYSEVLFRPGVIIVQVGSGANTVAYRRYMTEALDSKSRYLNEWLEVFTVEEDV